MLCFPLFGFKLPHLPIVFLVVNICLNLEHFRHFDQSRRCSIFIHKLLASPRKSLVLVFTNRFEHIHAGILIMNPRLGAMLYIDQSDSLELLRSRVREMAKAKLTLIRLFMYWDFVEPKPDTWNFDRFDAVFDEAQKQGSKVVPTLFSEAPPVWMKLSSGRQSSALDLETPGLWERAAKYIEKSVHRYKNHPALDSWILWNEACFYQIANSPQMQSLYRTFLEKEGRLLKIQGANDAPWEEIVPDCRKDLNFLVWYLMRKIRQVFDEIKKHDAEHPVHVNPHRIPENLFTRGQSMWKEGDIVDFMGASAHPVVHCTRFPQERYAQSIGLIAALARSSTRDQSRKFWITELQGGPTLMSRRIAFNPSYKEMNLWLNEAFGCGAEAVVFWSYNPRLYGGEAGEWGLISQTGEVTPRLQASIDMANFTTDFKTLKSAKPPTSKVLILYSELSIMMSHGFSSDENKLNPNNKMCGTDAICGAYCCLRDCGFEVDFIDESRIQEKAWMNTTSVIVLPGLLTIEPGTRECLQEFAQNGGIVIADGLLGHRDIHGGWDPAHSKSIDELFGIRLFEYDFCSDQEIPLFLDKESVTAWHFKGLLKPTTPSTKVLGSWENGDCGFTRFETGKGATYRLATQLFQYYYIQFSPSTRALIKQLISPCVVQPLSFDGDYPLVSLHHLEAPTGSIISLANQGPARDICLKAAFDGTFAKYKEQSTQIKKDHSLKLKLEEGEVIWAEYHHRLK